jgi:hypothetical protein
MPPQGVALNRQVYFFAAIERIDGMGWIKRLNSGSAMTIICLVVRRGFGIVPLPCGVLTIPAATPYSTTLAHLPSRSWR